MLRYLGNEAVLIPNPIYLKSNVCLCRYQLDTYCDDLVKHYYVGNISCKQYEFGIPDHLVTRDVTNNN